MQLEVYSKSMYPPEKQANKNKQNRTKKQCIQHGICFYSYDIPVTILWFLCTNSGELNEKLLAQIVLQTEQHGTNISEFIISRNHILGANKV